MTPDMTLEVADKGGGGIWGFPPFWGLFLFGLPSSQGLVSAGGGLVYTQRLCLGIWGLIFWLAAAPFAVSYEVRGVLILSGGCCNGKCSVLWLWKYDAEEDPLGVDRKF